MNNAGSSSTDSAAEHVVTALREAMLAAAVSAVDEDQLQRARRLIEQAGVLLSARTSETGRRITMDRAAIARIQAGTPWQVFTHNPLGIPQRIAVDGATATATVAPSALFEGPPGLLHGGFSAAMLDALLSTLVQAQDIKAVTVQLDVAFHAAAPVTHPLTVRGAVTEVSGRKLRAEGTIHSAEVLAVSAHALFITVPGDPD